MNMNKALQNLYHAVSGSTTTKVNISKLLVDIHYAITGVESSVKNNWSRIIDSMATNWPEGGGGGSSDFSTAQVTVVNNTEEAFVLYFPNIFDDQISTFLDSADIDGSPVDAVLYKDACRITYTSDDTLNISVTGNATISRKKVVIVTGDCTITIS